MFSNVNSSVCSGVKNRVLTSSTGDQMQITGSMCHSFKPFLAAPTVLYVNKAILSPEYSTSLKLIICLVYLNDIGKVTGMGSVPISAIIHWIKTYHHD